jgi:hypothetical protein
MMMDLPRTWVYTTSPGSPSAIYLRGKTLLQAYRKPDPIGSLGTRQPSNMMDYPAAPHIYFQEFETAFVGSMRMFLVNEYELG